MLRGASIRTVSKHQEFDYFENWAWHLSGNSCGFYRDLALFELGVRDKRERGIGTGLSPFGEVAETGRSLLLDALVLSQREPACLEDADGFRDGRQLHTDRPGCWPEVE